MLTLIKSPDSEEDLIDIWSYIAEDQPLNADRFLDRLHEAMMRLAETPKKGIERPELIKGLRSYPVGTYLLYYRINDDKLEIVRVLSASRDVEKVDW